MNLDKTIQAMRQEQEDKELQLRVNAAVDQRIGQLLAEFAHNQHTIKALDLFLSRCGLEIVKFPQFSQIAYSDPLRRGLYDDRKFDFVHDAYAAALSLALMQETEKAKQPTVEAVTP